MGLATYDKAVLNKVKEWFKNTIYANTAITYNIIYNLIDIDLKTNQIQFPLINIYRVNLDFSADQMFAARRQGGILGEIEYGETSLVLGGRYLSMDLIYQIDFYSKSSENLYDLLIQVAQAMNQYPVIEVTHIDPKTGTEFEERYELVLVSSPVEQSEFDNDDRIYRAYIQYGLNKVRTYDITDYTKIQDIELGVTLHETIEKLSKTFEVELKTPYIKESSDTE